MSGPIRPDRERADCSNKSGKSSVLLGRYAIERRLGPKSVCDVFLARNTETDCLVALKIPRLAKDAKPALVQRLIRDARAAAKFKHPNLCPINDLGVIEGRHYLTMPFVEGRSLSEFIRSGKTFPERHVVLYGRKLAQAMEHAHQLGVVHGDLKPSNIIVNDQKEPVIVDFGHVPASAEPPRSSKAPIAYLSPEQAAGMTEVGPASDIYSLGVILYELLTGQTPFQGDADSILALIQSANPPSPRLLRPELDPRLEVICRRAMSRKPMDRFSSMGEFASALGQLIEAGDSMVGAPAAPSSRPAPRAAAPATPSRAPATQKPVSPIASAPLSTSDDGLVDLSQGLGLSPLGPGLDAQELTALSSGAGAVVRPQNSPADSDSKRVLILASLAGGSVLALLILAIVVTRLVDGDAHRPSTEVASRSAPDDLAANSGGAYNPPPPPRDDSSELARSSSADSNNASGPSASTAYGPAPASNSPPTVTPGSSLPSEPENAGAVASADGAASGVNRESSSRAPGISGLATLDQSIVKWHAQTGMPLRGARAVSGQDVVVQHYSWLCELLPHLGHEDVYNKFRFDQPWAEEPNLQLTSTLVPQFLNPTDDRHRWQGYPFQNMALTHFVGMSGVEDRPNDVAAKLPRADSRAGVFGYAEIAKPEQITDGVSQTIAVLGSGELVSPWVQGGGATVRGARQPYFDPLTGFGTKGPSGGVSAMFADGSVRHISPNIDPRVFRAMCTIHGADTVDLSHANPLAGGFPAAKVELEPLGARATPRAGISTP